MNKTVFWIFLAALLLLAAATGCYIFGAKAAKNTPRADRPEGSPPAAEGGAVREAAPQDGSPLLPTAPRELRPPDDKQKDDPEAGRFVCVLAKGGGEAYDYYIKELPDKDRQPPHPSAYNLPVVMNIKNRKANRIVYSKSVYMSYRDAELVFEPVVTDFMVKDGVMSFIWLAGYGMYYYEGSIKGKPSPDPLKEVWVHVLHPRNDVTCITEAVFAAPRVIKTANAEGGEYMVRIVGSKITVSRDKEGRIILPKGIPEKERAKYEKAALEREGLTELVTEPVWWNGIGDRLRLDQACLHYKKTPTGKTPPSYSSGVFRGCLRMDERTRQMMQSRLNDYQESVRERNRLKHDTKAPRGK